MTDPIRPERVNAIINRRGEDVTVIEYVNDADKMDEAGWYGPTEDLSYTETTHKVLFQYIKMAKRFGMPADEEAERSIVFAKNDCPIKIDNNYNYIIKRNLTGASGNYSVLNVSDYIVMSGSGNKIIYKKIDVVKKW